MLSLCQVGVKRGGRMNHTKKARILTDLISGIFRINGSIISTGNLLIKDLGLTSSRWQVLGSLIDKPKTVSEIARQMGLSRQNVQRLTNRLIDDGFIETIENPYHLRSKLCSLTVSGKDTMDEITRRQIKWANKVSENLDLENLLITLKEINNLHCKLENE